MNKIKTPIELLRARKMFLDVETKRITNSLINTLEYGQENMAPMLSTTIIGAIYPNLPGFVQKLIAGSGEKRIHSGLKSDAWSTISEGILDILPFFLKGKKGVITSFLLKKLNNLFLR